MTNEPSDDATAKFLKNLLANAAQVPTRRATEGAIVQMDKEAGIMLVDRTDDKLLLLRFEEEPSAALRDKLTDLGFRTDHQMENARRDMPLNWRYRKYESKNDRDMLLDEVTDFYAEIRSMLRREKGLGEAKDGPGVG